MNQEFEDYGNNGECTNDYNWDDLSIGNMHQNHSDFFFARKHPEHSMNIEKADDFPENNENAENHAIQDDFKSPGSIDSDYLSSEMEFIQNGNGCRSPLRNNNLPNLKTKERTPKQMDKVPETKDFNVVRVGKQYEQRKKARMEELERIEREKRKFRSKPAPNFSAIHAAMDNKRAEFQQKLTIPSTPLVVKHDREMKQLWQKRREDFEASRKPKPFVSNDADVLKQKPFVPHISKKPTTELVPFNLHSDDRLKHRRQFDEQTRAELEKKKQEEEKQRQEEDERIRREIRKASTFKAQPNPFK